MSCLILEARTEYPRRHLCFGAFFPAWMLCAVLPPSNEAGDWGGQYDCDRQADRRWAAFPLPTNPCGFRLVREERPALGNCRVSENRIAQHGKWHSPDHRSLNGGHQLSRLDAKRGESQDFVAVFAYQHLHEAARFGNRPGAEHSGHRHLRHTVFNSIVSRSDSLRPTRASSGSVNVQNGIRRSFVVRLPPFKLSCTTRKLVVPRPLPAGLV
jgi:hypothetical protein